MAGNSPHAWTFSRWDTESVHNRDSNFRRKTISPGFAFSFKYSKRVASSVSVLWRPNASYLVMTPTARNTQRTVPHNESCGRIIQRRWQINAIWIRSISWMPAIEENWRHWVGGKRCQSGTSPTTNPILSEWGRDRIRVTDSNAQRPWDKPS